MVLLCCNETEHWMLRVPRVPAHAVLTGKQWKHLRKWIPAPAATGRPITRSRRVLLDGIAWRVRTGSPWRFVPETAFGPQETVYGLFRTWQLKGIWPMLLKTILTPWTRQDD